MEQQTQAVEVPNLSPKSQVKKDDVYADEFLCYVAVARLAVELARMQGSPGSADQFLEQSLDLIKQAEEKIDGRNRMIFTITPL